MENYQEAAYEFKGEFETFKEAWENCINGNLMLELSQKLEVEIHTLMGTKSLQAETFKLLKRGSKISSIKDGEFRISKRHALGIALKSSIAYIVIWISGYFTSDTFYSYDKFFDPSGYDINLYVKGEPNYIFIHIVSLFGSIVVASMLYDWRRRKDFITHASVQEECRLKTANICRTYLTKLVFDKLNIKA